MKGKGPRALPPPGGRGLWKTSAVRAILNNKIYMGRREWNCRTEAKYHFLQNGTPVPRPRCDKGKVIEHEERDRIRVHIPHIALVSEEVWHRAQKVRAKRARVDYRENAHLHTHSLLGGKIYCSDCGEKMYGHHSKKQKTLAGVLKEYIQHLYVCSTYLNSGKDQCNYNKIPRMALERLRSCPEHPARGARGRRRQGQAGGRSRWNCASSAPTAAPSRSCRSTGPSSRRRRQSPGGAPSGRTHQARGCGPAGPPCSPTRGACRRR